MTAGPSGHGGPPPELDYQSVVPYLVSHGLLEAGHLGPGLCVEERRAHRNSVFRVATARGPSYVVKQRETDGEGAAALAREADVYRLIGPGGSHDLGWGALPRLHLHDARRGVLVLDRIGGAEDLDAAHARRGRIDGALARQLGAALGRLHALELDRDCLPAAAAVERSPWILTMHVPDPFAVAQLGGGQLQLTKLVQQFPALGRELEALQREAEETALIHGDLRWANILAASAPARQPRIAIVDWELARFGDPRWDLGTLLAEHLAACFGGGAGRAEVARRVRHARSSVLALWRAYAAQSRIAGEHSAWLIGAVRCAAAKLVQTAMERAAGHASLPERALDLLQLSLNAFRRPREVAADILRLPLGAPRGSRD